MAIADSQLRQAFDDHHHKKRNPSHWPDLANAQHAPSLCACFFQTLRWTTKCAKTRRLRKWTVLPLQTQPDRLSVPPAGPSVTRADARPAGRPHPSAAVARAPQQGLRPRRTSVVPSAASPMDRHGPSAGPFVVRCPPRAGGAAPPPAPHGPPPPPRRPACRRRATRPRVAATALVTEKQRWRPRGKGCRRNTPPRIRLQNLVGRRRARRRADVATRLGVVRGHPHPHCGRGRGAPPHPRGIVW